MKTTHVYVESRLALWIAATCECPLPLLSWCFVIKYTMHTSHLWCAAAAGCPRAQTSRQSAARAACRLPRPLWIAAACECPSAAWAKACNSPAPQCPWAPCPPSKNWILRRGIFFFHFFKGYYSDKGKYTYISIYLYNCMYYRWLPVGEHVLHQLHVTALPLLSFFLLP